MNIFRTNSLSEVQKDQIKELERISFAEDGLENHALLTNELNYYREIPCYYLGYEAEQLIAFLSFFEPDKEEAEIFACTHPDYRRKGYFGALLKEAEKELEHFGITRVLLVVETKSNTGNAVIDKMKAVNSSVGKPRVIKWKFAEYRMEYKLGERTLPQGNWRFERITEQERDVYRQISFEAFPGEGHEERFLDTAIHSENRKGYILYQGEEPVGILSIGTEEETGIYGVGIADKFRGKGLGKILVDFGINQALKHSDTIVLDVDSENPVAKAVYEKAGFRTTFQIDYFEYSMV